MMSSQSSRSGITLRVALVASIGVGACSGDDGFRNPRTDPAPSPASTSKVMGRDPGSLVVTVSGGTTATRGFAFPANSAADEVFVDGWELTFSRVLVTVANITLSSAPDTSPGDSSQTGPLLARLPGPWAIDLHASGPLVGRSGGDERALQIDLFGAESGLLDFDPTVRYAFGFDIIPAHPLATPANFDGAAAADYAAMIAAGYSVLYVGTAVWKGGGGCSFGGKYDASVLPTRVDFRFGFRAPASFVNCQNPDNDPAVPIQGEHHRRGVQVQNNTLVIAQITARLGDPFRDSVHPGAALRFDPIAARYVGAVGVPVAKTEDFVGLDFTAFHDAKGSVLPGRSCISTLATKPGPLSYDPGGAAVNPSAPPEAALRDHADYMSYLASTFARLNIDGSCHAGRNYPAPR